VKGIASRNSGWNNQGPESRHEGYPMAKNDWSRPSHHIGGNPQRFFSHLRRFLRSPHSRDLLVIGGGAAVAAFLLAIYMIPAVAKLVGGDMPVEFTVAAVGVALGVVGWAYQAANTRFGVADLFAAEIVTLCRVASVADFMPRYIRLFSGGAKFPPFASSQDYLVVFDNNAKDLEVLDGDVVRFVTQFYVYMKALEDTLGKGADPENAGWRESALTIIYNAFLAFESARQAITVLLDDSRERKEYVLTALLSEMPAYLLLLKEIPDNDSLRRQRIESRRDAYGRLIDDIQADLNKIEPPARDFADRIVRLWNFSSAKEGEVSLPPWLQPHQRPAAAN
jgi:hypothetical protein